MFYAITEHGVFSGKKLVELNKKLNGKLEEMEMKQIGNDKIINLTTKDLDFIQDKKRLSLIPIANLYKTDNSKVLMIVVLVVQFIILLKG